MRPIFIQPMLPTLVDDAPEGNNWIHEIKHDGYRSQFVIDNGKAKAFTRRGADWTAKYGPMVEAVAELPVKSANIDGEMVVLDAGGKSDYQVFRKAIKGNPGRLVFIAFDMLMLDGKDIRAQTTLERRLALRTVLAGASPASSSRKTCTAAGRLSTRSLTEWGWKAWSRSAPMPPT